MPGEESDFVVVGKPDIALAPLAFEQVYTHEPAALLLQRSTALRTDVGENHIT
jgi:hypothetical protein